MGTVIALTLALGLVVLVLVLVRWQTRRRRPVQERLVRIRLETARSRHRMTALTRATLRSMYATQPSSRTAEATAQDPRAA
jgi:hypothetical protein